MANHIEHDRWVPAHSMNAANARPLHYMRSWFTLSSQDVRAWGGRQRGRSERSAIDRLRV